MKIALTRWLRLTALPLLFSSAPLGAQEPAEASPTEEKPTTEASPPAARPPLTLERRPLPAAVAPDVPASTQKAEPSTPASVSSKWGARLYGFIELDAVRDSTQAFNDLGGWASTALPRAYTYQGSHGRTQFTARNSRFGFLVTPPSYHGVSTTGTLEGDFMGNQPSDANESSLITFGTFRLRVAAAQVETPYLDVLLGQGWVLFGWQPFFLPASTFLLPPPGEVFKRDAQLRLSHTFKSSPINLMVAASVNRPPQRDAEIPDLHAGLLLSFNGWRGIHSPGTDGQRLVGSGLDGLTLGVSAASRRFKVTDFQGTALGTTPDPRSGNSAQGYGLAADAMIPIIASRSLDDRSNALTLTGEFSTGTGYADLLGGLVSNAGGPTTPAVPYPAVPNSPDKYAPNIQGGLVTYDNAGGLHTINWRTLLVGLQYYLPPSGKLFISGNFAQAQSDNVAKWADPGQKGAIFDKTRYVDANLFWDATPALRLAASYQVLWQDFANGDRVRNDRAEFAAYLWL